MVLLYCKQTYKLYEAVHIKIVSSLEVISHTVLVISLEQIK